MFETLFGAEMPLAVRFFLAFLIVLGLIGAAAWAVRRFGSGRYRGAGQRGRQPRLAVIDHASVDARRRLILIRRDNVEHLLLIGGPTDVVVEPNIVRAMPASREAPATRAPAVAELLPRAIPLPDSGSSDSWPLQPEPVATAAAPASTRAQRDALTALADNLAVHPVTPSRTRPAAVVRPTVEPRAEPRSEPRPEPRVPTPPANPESPSAVDQNLAEMAHRLEAALRKPKTADAREAAAPSAAARATPSPEPSPQAEAPASPPAAPRPARAAEAQPARPDVPAKEGKALYDSLEQEMASLLGRPAGKI